MNTEIKPRLNLSPAERRYWKVIASMRTTDWSDDDSIVASLLARNMNTVEQAARDDIGQERMTPLLKMVREGAEMLNLRYRKPDAESVPHQILRVVLEEGRAP